MAVSATIVSKAVALIGAFMLTAPSVDRVRPGPIPAFANVTVPAWLLRVLDGDTSRLPPLLSKKRPVRASLRSFAPQRVSPK